jgi:ABC-2 type transport system permease protein
MARRDELARIVRHEWRVLRADSVLWIVIALLAALVVYGLANGVQWTRFQRATIQSALAEEGNRYSALKQQIRDIEGGRQRPPFADPRAPDAVGGRLAWRYAVIPPLPLAALSIGQSDVLPYYFRVSTAAKETVLTTNEIENPHRLLHGRIDLSFVVIYLVPLIIIAMGYSILSAEKEDGTLALLLSQPISIGTVAAGKIAVRAAIVIVLVGLFGSAGLMATGGGVSGGDVARLLVWTGIVAAYATFWFGAVVLVVSAGRTSAANALILVAVWLVLVVVLPSTLNMTVSVLYPMPSRVEMIAATRVASDEASAAGNQLLAKYYGDHPELVEVSNVQQALNDVAITRLAIDEEIERRVRPVVERFDAQLARQQAFVNRLRVLSPAIVAQEALNEVAGTGSGRYRHFMLQVDQYHRRWRSFFTSMTMRKVRMTASTYDDIPRFEYANEPLSSVLTRSAFTLVVLAVGGIALGAIGAVKLKTYPPT